MDSAQDTTAADKEATILRYLFHEEVEERLFANRKGI